MKTSSKLVLLTENEYEHAKERGEPVFRHTAIGCFRLETLDLDLPERTLEELIDQQCDHFAVGIQDKDYAKGLDGGETYCREVLRQNFEQFAQVFLPNMLKLKARTHKELASYKMERHELFKVLNEVRRAIYIVVQGAEDQGGFVVLGRTADLDALKDAHKALDDWCWDETLKDTETVSVYDVLQDLRKEINVNKTLFAFLDELSHIIQQENGWDFVINNIKINVDKTKDGVSTAVEALQKAYTFYTGVAS